MNLTRAAASSPVRGGSPPEIPIDSASHERGEVTCLTDDEIGDYYDRHQAHLVDDLPEEGRAHVRQRYLEGVRANREAQRQIREILDREGR